MESTQEPPRRRRRAARRAAGPPVPANRTALDAEPHPDEPAAELPVAAVVVTAGAADPAEPEALAALPHHAKSGHGSPGDAPGHHHPGPPTHSAGTPAGGSDRVDRPAGTGSGESRRPRSSREDAAERSLRSLVTTRTTQVSPTAALRAREVALPSAADLAAADAELVVVRRHYVPPTALTSGRRQDWPSRRSGAPRGQGKV